MYKKKTHLSVIVISFFNALICAFVHMAFFCVCTQGVNNEYNVVKKDDNFKLKTAIFVLYVVERQSSEHQTPAGANTAHQSTCTDC